MDLVSVEKYIPFVTEYGAKVLGALAFTLLAFWLAGKLKRVIRLAMERAKIDPTLGKFLSNLAKWTVLIAAGVSVLGMLGIQTASFAAVIAAMGLAVGLAFQGTLSNLASGVMLLVFRPFKVGQTIMVAGVSGVVDEIELFTTTIDTADKRRFIIPNAQIFGATIENVSHHSARRVDIAVGVDYQASIDDTRESLFAAFASVPGVLHDPAPAAVLVGLGQSSVDWAVRVWVKAEDYWAVKEALLKAIKISLDDAHINIPYPKMDINVSSTKAVATLTKEAGGAEIQSH